MRGHSSSVKSASLLVFILPASVGVRAACFRVICFLAVAIGRLGVKFATFRLVDTRTAS